MDELYKFFDKYRVKLRAAVFFKQKTAYEIRLSLVGSEMCIRDSTICFSAYEMLKYTTEYFKKLPQRESVCHA